MKWLNLVTGLTIGLVMVVVATYMLAGLYPAMNTALTTLNASNGATGLPLYQIIQPGGVLPLIVIAVFVIALVVGLFSMVNLGKKKGRDDED